MWLHVVSTAWSGWKINTSQLQRAGDSLYLPLWQRANNDFRGAFYFLKVNLACFAFLFLPPFTHKPLLGFVFFFSFVSHSVVSLPVLQFYLTNLSTF